MNIYEQLGVRTRINGAGTLTRLGGSLMPPDVLAAMVEAAQYSVDISELQARASTVIAECTGAEAGMVTSGASAALTLATAACLTGLDAAKMERLPDTEGMASEILMSRCHRTTYDHAIRAAGARIRDVGFNDSATGAGVRGVEPWEFEAAITSQTIAIAYTAFSANQPSLAAVAGLAKRHGLPVIVDAAAQLPPAENLRHFLAQGADLVAFSGGKAIRGPQSSGILCGRRDLIAAAVLQQLDMDVVPETWEPPADFIPRHLLHGIPHHGIGRGLKVGKEEIVGLLVALRRYVRLDAKSEEAGMEARLAPIAGALSGIPQVATRLLSSAETGRFPLLEVILDAAALGRTAWAISRELQRGTPPIHLSERRAADGILIVHPAALRPGDAEIIGNRLRAGLTTTV